MTTTTEGVTHLSDAGQIVIAFGAVSLALSLVYLGIACAAVVRDR